MRERKYFSLHPITRKNKTILFVSTRKSLEKLKQNVINEIVVYDTLSLSLSVGRSFVIHLDNSFSAKSPRVLRKKTRKYFMTHFPMNRIFRFGMSSGSKAFFLK